MDITYIPCNDGRLYLSTYIDLATRIPRCYMLDSNMKKEIVIHPLKIYKGELPAVIHSDRGSQYRSLSYQELLTDHHITHSVSQTGTPVDNAVIEAFHRSIK
jgi:putative transposase